MHNQILKYKKIQYDSQELKALWVFKNSQVKFRD